MLIDQSSITRALAIIPNENGARERLWSSLVDEQPDEGAYPRFADLQTVLDIRSVGVSGLTERGIDRADAEWILSKLGGAKRGRKPKES